LATSTRAGTSKINNFIKIDDLNNMQSIDPTQIKAKKQQLFTDIEETFYVK
jgi:hypothetical protein